MQTRHRHADLETPVSAYLKLRRGRDWSFLFESVEGPEHWATYSIIGVGARRTVSAADGHLTITDAAGSRIVDAPDPLAALRRAAAWQTANGLPPFVGGIFGFLSYDAVRHFEPVGTGPGRAEVADACFVQPEVLAVFDNRHHDLTLYSDDDAAIDAAVARLAGPLPPHHAGGPWQAPRAMTPPEAFAHSVDIAKEHIRAGDVIQVVVSRRFELPRVADPFDVYRGLRTINPSPYLFYFATPDVQLAGASPEVMLRVQSGEVIVRPIAGTRPRGRDAAEDAALARELLADPKERAEHIMLVDLGRNDVGRVSVPGSVTVPDLMTVEHYSHVMHLVSEVRGRLVAELDAFDALRAAFPAGTLSGAPKVRAMQIIDTLEHERRGVYGGAVGYFGPGGDADFGIAIRTLVAHPDRFVVQAGAGIVADSDPQRETEETEHKARAVLRAAQWAASDEAAW